MSEKFKQWFRDSIKPYLKLIKGDIETAKTELRQEMSSVSVTGTFKGSFATVANMPTTKGIKNGDWAVLTADDGSNESGIYVKSSSSWSFVADITSFDEVQAILATNEEFNAGTATQKAITVKQLADVFAETITDAEALEDWNEVR